MPAQSHIHWRHSNVVFGNLGDQFLWRLFEISSVRCLTDWRQSSETKETLFRTNICELSWSKVDFPYRCGNFDYELLYPVYFTLLTLLCRRVIVQFLSVATLMSIIILLNSYLHNILSHNFIDHTYRIMKSLSVYELYNIQLFALKIVHDDACHPILLLLLLLLLLLIIVKKNLAVYNAF